MCRSASSSGVTPGASWRSMYSGIDAAYVNPVCDDADNHGAPSPRGRSRKVSVILSSHPLPAERREHGRAARRRLSRRGLGHWAPDRDALAVVLDQSATRLADLVPLRHARMAASPWAYYRGAAAVMAADLATAPNTGLEVQLCGDSHALNFGLWATPERNL